VVEAVPLTRAVERNDEQVLGLERGELERRACALENRVAEPAVQGLEHGGTAKEVQPVCRQA
jgi:hypothetical protein